MTNGFTTKLPFRILQHLLFWLVFISLYALVKSLFAAPSDMMYPPLQRFGRFLLSELIFLPWKVLPFYGLFYFLIPRFFQRGRYLATALYFMALLVISIYGFRAMIRPVSWLLYKEVPDFQVYSLQRMIYTLTEIIPAIGLAASLKLFRNRMITQQREQELEKEKLAAELNYLKAQTNPHFLFNTLNNLYGLARRNDPNTATSIMKLAGIMRYILHECSAPTVALADELNVIENYIELEKLRYDDRLRVSFKQDIQHPQQHIAPLILLPFVENAFKHGAGESRFDPFIHIDLVSSEKQLQLHVNNSWDRDTEAPSTGIGLRNVQRQLDLIYGRHYTLNIQPQEEQFSVSLTIQLDQHASSQSDLPHHRG
ncbi:MAG: histidine kinase [Saprospiraceae bacterium]